MISRPLIAKQFSSLSKVQWLDGGEGDDVIYAEGGDDIINGGEGRDSLYGGSGLDTFILSPKAGDDLIFRFDTSVDVLGLTGGLSFEDLVINQGIGVNANNTLISLKNGDELLAALNGVQASSISSANFTFG